MCVPDSEYACNNYQENTAWMEASGNLCWGMGAANYVPCFTCGREKIYHDIRREREQND